MRFFLLLAIFGLGASALSLPNLDSRDSTDALESRTLPDPANELIDETAV
jgi:hypothetical protein